MQRVKYPVGIQSFEKLRTDGFLYIDKTAHIYDLITHGQYYFLSRPRRFGKSLLLSTLKAYFEGRKDLFEGLAIADLETEWVSRPVLMLTLSGYNPYQGNLSDIISNQFSQYEVTYGCSNETSDLGSRFGNLIRGAYEKTGKKVAILIDEYDSPMMSHLHDEERYEKVKALLKSVYVNLKDMDECIEFGMLTGVTRFSKMTIFSGLNNLNDISLDVKYGDICGITEDELVSNFKSGIQDLADENDLSYDKALAELKANYDGYHFTKKSEDIYNPFSLLMCMVKREFGAYWFQTATPTFLINEMKRLDVALPDILKEEATASTLSDIDSYRTSPTALLFQTGYLTIKSYDAEYDAYTLGIPNREVEKGLFSDMLASIAEVGNNVVDRTMLEIRRGFNNGNPDKALEAIKVFMAGIPAHLTRRKPEVYFENNLYLIFRLAGLDINTEWWTSEGRIDLLLKTKKYIYVIELKLDKSPEEALTQIDSKDYSLQFESDGRKIVKIGIAFSSEKRNIIDWIIR